jgi:glycosyltransferase involved in cell wall biosynthesis
MRAVLMIAPYFAPQAAVGAYRSVKLARHLPAQGFRPVVLAGTFPGDARDPALVRALPPEVVLRDAYLDPALVRARELLRGRAPPKAPRGPLTGLDPFHGLVDRYAAHGLHAAREALRLGREHRVAVVYGSLGPFSAGPVVLAVARRLGVPAVLDLRDPWALHETGARADEEGLAVRARAAFVRRAERGMLARADRVVLNNERTLAAYRAAYPFLASKSDFIRNAFDLALYDPPRVAPPDRFRVLHFGTLRADTPIDDLARGLRLFVDRERLGPDAVELVQIGHIGDHERGVVAALGLGAYFREGPRVPQADALSVLRGAHVLVVANTHVVSLRISAKTYDYVASGMPVLAISDNPELDALLAGRADHARVAPGDVESVARTLAARFAEYRATGALPTPTPPPAELSAERAAERLADVLRGCLA